MEVVMIRIASSTGAVFALSVALVGVLPTIGGAQTSPAAAIGKEVRVTGVDGSTGTGRLVSLSISDVVFQQKGKDVSIPLGQVSKVEKVSHGVRNGVVVGAISGILTGWWVSCGVWYDDGSCWTPGFLMIAGLGVGAGAGIGAIDNAAKSDDNLLYQAPGASSSVSVVPILSPRHAGLSVAMRW
jgi:hypothetical protein